jgi:hypothetical protein
MTSYECCERRKHRREERWLVEPKDPVTEDEQLLAEMRRHYEFATLENHMLVDGALYLRCTKCWLRPVPHGWSFIPRCNECLSDTASSVPPEAAKAARRAVSDVLRERGQRRIHLVLDRTVMAALEAAIPLIVAGERERLLAAEERVQLARQALLADGYFTEEQVGDDIAPRIIERLSAMRADTANLRP